MVHQFDDRLYVRSLQHESVQQHQQQNAQQRQLLTAAHQYTATPTSTASDYVMYTGSGNATGRGDIAATSPTTVCRRHHAASYVTDAALQTNQQHHHPPQQQQQHNYYTDYPRHHLGPESVGLGPGEDGRTSPVTVWWTYHPSTIGDTAACEGSSAGWPLPVSVGVQYSGCTQVDDPLDLLNHQLQNPDKPSHPDNIAYIYHTPSSDIRATAAVTTTTEYHLQPEPDVAGTVSAVKQHLIDIESRPHHVQASTEPSWVQSEPAFGWMKKQNFSAITQTGTHAHCF